MTRSRPPRKVTYFEPVPPRLARNTIIESTFEVGRRFRCTMRVDVDQGRLVDPCHGDLRLHSDVRPLRRRYCDGRGDRIANAGDNAQPPRRGASFGYPGRMQRELPNRFQISLRLATFDAFCSRKGSGTGFGT